MSETAYFEQFVGDVEMVQFYRISMPLKEFEALPQLEKEQHIRIAECFMIPKIVWDEWHKK